MHENTVVIIGAGMAGLTTAAYLTSAGFSVKVYEQHAQSGGYVSSFVRRGYRFPAGPTSFGSNGIVFPILRELGLQNDARFVRARHQISYQGHDIPLRDPAQTAHTLQRCFPKETEALKRYYRWVSIGANAFFDSLKGGMMFGRNILKALLQLGFVHPLFLWAKHKAKKHTNRSLHAHYFKDSLLRQLHDGIGYPVMTGENTLGMWASYYYDTWVPVGGTQSFSDLFVRFVQKNGGEVHLNAGVRRIRVENGQASGVELQNGEFVPARWVVSAADLNHTCFSLIGSENLPLSMTDKLLKTTTQRIAVCRFFGFARQPESLCRLEAIRRKPCRFHLCRRQSHTARIVEHG